MLIEVCTTRIHTEKLTQHLSVYYQSFKGHSQLSSLLLG